jgi:membrane protease YdiL (CAAX protease family)
VVASVVGAEQAAALLALFVLLDLVPELLFSVYWRSLVRRGVPAVFPLSVLQAEQVAVPDARNLAIVLSQTAVLWPFIEESVFRVTPYLLGGGPLLFAFSAAWALAHVHKVVSLNKHLDTPNLTRLTAAYTLTLMSAGAFYAYAASVNPLIPYALHSAHNTVAVLLNYLEARPRQGEPRFIGKEEQRAEEQAVARQGRQGAATAAELLSRLQGSFGLYSAALCVDSEWVERELSRSRERFIWLQRRKGSERA